MSDYLPLLVGESPSKTGDRYWRFPLSGSPARVLCLCAGWEPHGPAREPGSWTWALYERFSTRNVFRRFADADPWDPRRARHEAQGIVRDEVHRATEAGDVARLVLLGRRVANAFGIGEAPYFDQVTLQTLDGLATAVVIPHPSGRNLLMNDPLIRDQVGIALRTAAGESVRTPTSLGD